MWYNNKVDARKLISPSNVSDQEMKNLDSGEEIKAVEELKNLEGGKE